MKTRPQLLGSMLTQQLQIPHVHFLLHVIVTVHYKCNLYSHYQSISLFIGKQKELAIFNIVDRVNVELVYQCSDVNYWKWISDETIGIVSEKVNLFKTIFF